MGVVCFISKYGILTFRILFLVKAFTMSCFGCFGSKKPKPRPRNLNEKPGSYPYTSTPFIKSEPTVPKLEQQAIEASAKEEPSVDTIDSSEEIVVKLHEKTGKSELQLPSDTSLFDDSDRAVEENEQTDQKTTTSSSFEEIEIQLADSDR